MNKIITIPILCLSFLLASCSSNSGEHLSGAGATFPAPFYNIVFRAYTDSTSNPVNYGAIGSGGGIRSLRDMTIDFGASDVYLSDKELTTMGAEVIHIPAAVGGIVLAYNIPNVKELKLTAEIITDIYLGEITNWSDAKIAAINPEQALPNLEITPIYRSDGSGTTYVFSDYMSKANATWKEKLKRGKALNFPKGIASKGNPGVAGVIAETKGAFGYIGAEYAFALDMSVAKLQNKSGNFVEANERSISLSADIDIPDDTRIMITNSDNPEAYPISTFTWLIFYKEQSYINRPIEKAHALRKLMLYVTGKEGQDMAKRTHYASLPPLTKEKVDKLLNSITYQGTEIR